MAYGEGLQCSHQAFFAMVTLEYDTVTPLDSFCGNAVKSSFAAIRLMYVAELIL